jgi:hypothetical protein
MTFWDTLLDVAGQLGLLVAAVAGPVAVIVLTIVIAGGLLQLRPLWMRVVGWTAFTLLVLGEMAVFVALLVHYGGER